MIISNTYTPTPETFSLECVEADLPALGPHVVYLSIVLLNITERIGFSYAAPGVEFVFVRPGELAGRSRPRVPESRRCGERAGAQDQRIRGSLPTSR